MYLNSVTLTGFLGGDAENRTTKNNVNLTVFSLATKSSWRDADRGEWLSHTDWHRCVAFGRLAQAAALLKSGDYVHVQG
jgi:single-strand DNA-binding protein